MSRTFAIAAFTAGVLALGCATSTEPEPVPEPEPVVVAEPEPAPPPPPPVAVPVAEPVRAPVRELPKTASALPLVGLVGVAALGLGAVTGVARRRLARGR